MLSEEAGRSAIDVKLRRKLKKVYGEGINDVDYPVHKFEYRRNEKGNLEVANRVWTCPFYSRWREMLRRCYSNSFISKNVTYRGATVCQEWKTFSVFKEWMEEQSWEGKDLDKDLLVEGNLLYSPETCIFIPKTLNQFFKDRSNDRGNLPLGVIFKKKQGKYNARCSNPFTGKRESLGMYNTPEEAHQAWMRRKHVLSNEWADILEKEGYPHTVVSALRNRYKPKGEPMKTILKQLHQIHDHDDEVQMNKRLAWVNQHTQRQEAIKKANEMNLKGNDYSNYMISFDRQYFDTQNTAQSIFH